jgi:hypothetical protein
VQVDFRAAQITSFLKEVVKTVSDIDSSLDVGAYVLPFAASADGYYGNTQSGNDYSQYTGNWIKIMPMVPHHFSSTPHTPHAHATHDLCVQVYWQDWATADNFYDWVNQTIFYANHLTKVRVAVICYINYYFFSFSVYYMLLFYCFTANIFIITLWF